MQTACDIYFHDKGKPKMHVTKLHNRITTQWKNKRQNPKMLPLSPSLCEINVMDFGVPVSYRHSS